MTLSAARPSTLSPFRHRVFLAPWLASLASNLGNAIQSVGEDADPDGRRLA